MKGGGATGSSFLNLAGRSYDATAFYNVYLLL
jgi:hypothetical protein